jgi:hypothetical protein
MVTKKKLPPCETVRVGLAGLILVEFDASGYRLLVG